MHPDISKYSSDISGTDIVYIPDFLEDWETEALLKTVSKVLRGDKKESPLIGYTNDGNTNSETAPYLFLNMDPSIRGLLEDIINRSIDTYESLYGVDQNITFINLGTINVMGEGDGMDVHADNPPSLAQGIDTPHGLVLYLNDDYEGGEIYYPNLNIVIKPKAGSLVIHPGTIEYSHGVVPVVSGTRYATTAFSKKPLL